MLTAVGLLLTAFIFEKHFENYFPLEEGKVLEYSFTSAKDGNVVEKAKVTVTNLAPKTLDNKTVIPRKYEKVTQKGDKQTYTGFFLNDKEGVLFWAVQGDKDDQPKPLPQKIYYLKNPLKVAATWGGGEAPKGSIESTDEKVAVAAGSFSGCVRVKIAYPENMPLKESLYWFAENVGIIKSSYTYKNGVQEQFELLAVR
uniref:DUF3108 domain-containing protein n=1 Tax=Desulfobacca acetoxidans TaxID=60893 RepID=A0A7V4G953_9BACT